MVKRSFLAFTIKTNLRLFGKSKKYVASKTAGNPFWLRNLMRTVVIAREL